MLPGWWFEHCSSWCEIRSAFDLVVESWMLEHVDGWIRAACDNEERRGRPGCVFAIRTLCLRQASAQALIWWTAQTVHSPSLWGIPDEPAAIEWFFLSHTLVLRETALLDWPRVITLVLVSHPYSLTMSNISTLRRRRGVVRAGITRLTNHLKDLEKDADRPTTLDLARGMTRKLDALDSDFRTPSIFWVGNHLKSMRAWWCVRKSESRASNLRVIPRARSRVVGRSASFSKSFKRLVRRVMLARTTPLLLLRVEMLLIVNE